ncbi:ABC transporter [Plantibacter sp. H53]|uniref:energy-coupling factor transporter transmembrane component T family protein n=1 Tax=unclassified Plantibacter TaxID=2624265 RepID=UPI0007DA2551|nr:MULTISPECIES: energy-coupling factor transporter transmembrane component T [unclassified Plantibacter]OAN33510.1 ABC transporter [Plantibacter sp. H53]OII40906.1 ABC transporter [Plantibacter sp. MMLR14_011]
MTSLTAAERSTVLHHRPPLDRVNPVTKVLAVLILSVPLLLTIDWVSASTAVLLEVMLFPLSGLRFTALLKRALPVLVFAPIGGISMLLYAKPGGTEYLSLGFVRVTDNSIELAVAVTIRVLALGLPTILLFARVDPTDLADGLSQIAKLPSRFVLGILAGARMLGLFIDDWRSLALARRARGLGDRGVVRRFASMAFVLLVFAIRRGSKLATAMEARGFGAPIERTWARPSRLGRADLIAVLVTIVIMALALSTAVLAGTFRVVGQ